MNTSASLNEIGEARAQRVSVTEDSLIVELVDGRTVTVPVTWYPRLAHGTPTERAHCRLIGEGEGVHWPARRTAVRRITSVVTEMVRVSQAMTHPTQGIAVPGGTE